MATLAFEVSLFALVLHNLWNLWRAIGLSSVVTVPLWWAWSLLLEACPFCGVMALAKDLVYRCAMHFIGRKLHSIVVLQSFVEGCLMMALRFYPIQEETWIGTLRIIHELLPVHRTDPLGMLWVCVKVGGYHCSWRATLVAYLTHVPLVHVSHILAPSGTAGCQLVKVLLRQSVRHSGLSNFLLRLVMLRFTPATSLRDCNVSSILTFPPISADQLFNSSV